MRGNGNVTDGYKKRKYPDNRAGRAPVRTQHISSPEGRVFLNMVVLIGDELVGGTDAYLVTRDHKGNGLNKDALFRQVNILMPGYAAFYEKTRGEILTAEICYGRWFMKSAYANGPDGTRGKNKAARGPEHPTASKRLRACLPRVEEAFRAKVPLTIEKMRELGTL